MWFLRLLSRFPLWFQQGIGALLGRLTWWLAPVYRQRFKANVAQAGLGMAEAAAAIGHIGRMMGELPWMWLRPFGEPLGARVQWDGAELITAALDQGRGLILLTPHLGCFEVTAQAYVEHFSAKYGPLTVLFRPARKAWMRELVDASRERPGLLPAPASLAGVRQMLRALRQGQAVGLLPDQVPPDGLGVWAPFFGKPAYTMTLAGRLAQQTGAVPVLIWGERLPWGRGFVVRVRPGPVIAREDTPECAATAVNQSMESIIRQLPGQYLWSYNRYKAPRRVDVAALGDGS